MGYHNLTEYESGDRPLAQPPTKENYPTIHCSSCGREFLKLKDNCPHCGHDPTQIGDDVTRRISPETAEYHIDVTETSPDQWGVGILLDAPFKEVAKSFAEIATRNVTSVSESSSEKTGYRSPTIEIGIKDGDVFPDPLRKVNPNIECIPVGEGDHEALDRLTDATDWKTREPKPYLYDEYGTPIVDSDALETYLSKENPQWLVIGTATETVASINGVTYERPLECGYCNRRTVHRFVGRDGSPNESETEDESMPVWECAECGGYRLGPDIHALDEPETDNQSSEPTEETAFIEIDPAPNKFETICEEETMRPDFPDEPNIDLKNQKDSPTLT